MQTDSQGGRQAVMETDRHADRQTDRHADRQSGRQTDSQGGRLTMVKYWSSHKLGRFVFPQGASSFLTRSVM